MADTSQGSVAKQSAKPEIPKELSKQNPVFRMMGLPNFRFRLPSRNWMIFWTVTGSFAGAVFYDRRQKKAVQQKWCDLVAHISQETVPVNQMPRKITVFLSAPPGDTIGPSRKFFKEYVKPVLVAAAMDYDVIEGRKEGEVRQGTAEQIRRYRRKRGETSNTLLEEDITTAIEGVREKLDVRSEPGLRGDLVLGRHTWKEYIRGIHEGWLGPLDEPVETEDVVINPSPELLSPQDTTENPNTASESQSDNSPETKRPEEEKEKKKLQLPPAYISISEYSSAPLSPYVPVTLEPSQPLHQQHMLGFLKTPTRVYNFLNRRKLADQLGRDTAAIVLAAHRPYQYSESFASTSSSNLNDDPAVSTRSPESDAPAPSDVSVVQTGSEYEQQSVLEPDEYYWHKSVRRPKSKGDETERVWLNDVVLDPRIAERMRRFELDPEESLRAQRIWEGTETGRAREIEDLTQAKINIGSVEGEDS